MSREVVDRTASVIFDSQKALDRHAAMRARADRTVRERRTTSIWRIWYLKAGRIIGGWTLWEGIPARMTELTIIDPDDARRQVEQVEREAAEQRARAEKGLEEMFSTREAFEKYRRMTLDSDRIVRAYVGQSAVLICLLKNGRLLGVWSQGGYGRRRMAEREFKNAREARRTLEMAESIEAERMARERGIEEHRAAAADEAVKSIREDFDFGYRPVSYWKHAGRRHANIKGTLRRRALAAQADPGDDTPMPPEISAESISDEDKYTLQRLHPSLRGGEDLPDAEDGEVEIARLAYTQTVHCEVTSIRAQRHRRRIRYRVVDEYGRNIICWREWSDGPLTFGQLIDLISTATYEDDDDFEGLYFGDLGRRVRIEEHEPEDLEGFIEVTSPFYPDLGRYYEEAFQDWCESERESRAEDEEGDELDD